MLDRISTLVGEYREIERKLQDPLLYDRPAEMATLSKRAAQLKAVVDVWDDYETWGKTLAEAHAMKQDPEMGAIALEQEVEATQRLTALRTTMQEILLPKDPLDEHDAILEVRAGTGGDEAALFAAELLRAYLRFAEMHGWKGILLDKTLTEQGGLKEATVEIQGSGVFGKLKFEGGVHRVQRIPATESKGRIHTSAASVAVLPKVEEQDYVIRQEDLRMDTYRSGGAGGQHVNKTESAVRITHVPTGTVVACQSERSQIQNRLRAMDMLRAKLFAVQEEKKAEKEGDLRSTQIKSGDRSDKIRTYNFPQDRVTDHRINQSFHNVPAIMEGELSPIIDAVQKAVREKQISGENIA